MSESPHDSPSTKRITGLFLLPFLGWMLLFRSREKVVRQMYLPGPGDEAKSLEEVRASWRSRHNREENREAEERAEGSGVWIARAQGLWLIFWLNLVPVAVTGVGYCVLRNESVPEQVVGAVFTLPAVFGSALICAFSLQRPFNRLLFKLRGMEYLEMDPFPETSPAAGVTPPQTEASSGPSMLRFTLAWLGVMAAFLSFHLITRDRGGTILAETISLPDERAVTRRLDLKSGEQFTLGVVVEAGDPVDVVLAPELLAFNPGNAKNADEFQSRGWVLEYTLADQRWGHPGWGVLTLSSSGKSTVRVEVSRRP